MGKKGGKQLKELWVPGNIGEASGGSLHLQNFLTNLSLSLENPTSLLDSVLGADVSRESTFMIKSLALQMGCETIR